MSWVTITQEVIFPRQAELAQVLAVKVPGGETAASLLAAAMGQVVSEARGYLRAAVRKGFLGAMGDEGTVPASLVQSVAVLVRRAVLGRLPGLQSLHNQIRDEECRAAERLIRDVATGANVVEEPGGAGGAVTSPRPMVLGRQRDFTRETEDGV